MFNSEVRDIVRGQRKALGVLAGSEKRALLLATVIMIAVGFLTNLPALFLGKLVDSVLTEANATFALAVPFIVAISLMLIVKEALTVWRKYLVENVATHTEKHVSVMLLAHVLRLDSAVLGARQVGALHGRMGRSVQGLIRMIKLGFLDFFPTVFTAIAALIIVFTQEQFLAGFMLLVIPTGLYIVFMQIGSQKGIRVTLLREKEKMDGAAVEMFSGIETIRALNTVDREVGRVETVAEKLRVIEIKHHIHMALYDAAKYLNEAFFYVLVVSIAIYLATQGMISSGDILTYSILFTSVINPLRSIHRILDEAHESSIKVNDLTELLDSPQDISYNTKDSSEEKEGMEAIRLENISFGYTEDLKILDDVSLSIRQGEKIGMVGASGCGKSTMVKLLLRLIHGYEGTASVHGTDLKSLSRADVARLFAYVPQQPFIFSGSVRDNLTYGTDSLPSEEILQDVLEKVNLKKEIEEMGGIDAVISERGGNISGGQRQRLAIARLMLSTPEIVILDEATAALDNTNEAQIQSHIETVFADATVIIIAHRLTTLRNVDRILVFENGKIVQEGKYDELAEQDGLFKQFLNE